MGRRDDSFTASANDVGATSQGACGAQSYYDNISNGGTQSANAQGVQNHALTSKITKT